MKMRFAWDKAGVIFKSIDTNKKGAVIAPFLFSVILFSINFDDPFD